MARFGDTDMVVEIRKHAPEASDPEIEGQFKRAVIEFCRQSHVWQVELEPLPVVAGERVYQMDVPGGARLERLIRLTYAGASAAGRRPMRQVNVAEIENRDEDTGQPRAFAIRENTGEVLVYPTPGASEVDDTGALRAFAVLVPRRSARGFPDFIYEEYFDELAAGAVARLQAIAGRPFENQGLALGNRRRFAQGVNRAKRQAINNAWTPQRAKLRDWR